jgi:16S rRNA (uracil1498-N3)-methyltransferase
MGRVPHIYLPAPWPEDLVPLPAATAAHLTRVLRLAPGAPLSYTDGAGRVGAGTLASAAVARGDERREPPPEPPLTVAVAPPRTAARARWIVEKLAELGVDRLAWLETERGEGRAPRAAKAHAWAAAALEQSRGAHLLGVDGPVSWADLQPPLLVAMPGADPLPTVAGAATVVIGPEGGFDPEEVPEAAVGFGLGRRILRVETAAVVAATRLLAAVGRQ